MDVLSKDMGEIEETRICTLIYPQSVSKLVQTRGTEFNSEKLLKLESLESVMVIISSGMECG